MSAPSSPEPSGSGSPRSGIGEIGDEPPRGVRAAGLAAALQGLVVLVIGVVLLVTQGGPEVWAFVILFGGGVAAAGIALVRGSRSVRSPLVVVQILLLGVAYYAAVYSDRPDWGFPLALLCAGILAGILHRAGRDWAVPPP